MFILHYLIFNVTHSGVLAYHIQKTIKLNITY